MFKQIVSGYKVCGITQGIQKGPEINLQKQSVQTKRVIGNFDK